MEKEKTWEDYADAMIAALNALTTDGVIADSPYRQKIVSELLRAGILGRSKDGLYLADDPNELRIDYDMRLAERREIAKDAKSARRWAAISAVAAVIGVAASLFGLLRAL